MRILYSKQAREQLYGIKRYISSDNPGFAVEYLKRIKSKIEILKTFPYLGKVNATFNIPAIRDFVVLGYKVIYKVHNETITILAVYKYIDFDESSVLIQDE